MKQTIFHLNTKTNFIPPVKKEKNQPGTESPKQLTENLFAKMISHLPKA